VVISGHQWSSEVISGHQWSSVEVWKLRHTIWEPIDQAAMSTGASMLDESGRSTSGSTRCGEQSEEAIRRGHQEAIDDTHLDARRRGRRA
jgi:hypothetical protein